ncbi:hypothetical protein A2872_00325 [Candidatus Gottesmanbacteria bacterium RIFCSPHIGHO2_01_FULL_42_12]|uniref:Bacterial Ig domain-containing protein n=1 Tax=Candidatus Gottesmanbacteria bacterium RIFCSPHIGHO2_01_FULL_42_12 TaxID=1798377 RepID=A0A1F5Z3C5_9BACT|nr:MAG: hypothetical protein A2872_00325 [Candidatus Gottesmanbacteria bacterium RIFCSPHIGHO2_01_FULL_42_12]
MGEKFFTAGIGIILGVIIAAGIFFGPRLLAKVNPTQDNPLSPLASPTPAPVSVISLDNRPVVITSLSDGQIVREKTVEVSGKTSPGIAVTLTTSADEQFTKSDNDGNFSGKLKIDEGENTVVAAVTDGRGTLQIDRKQIILEVSE